MAMAPQERSSASPTKPPLHNFSLPCLKWGQQRLLRCVKLTDTDDHHHHHHHHHHQQLPSSSSVPANNGNGFIQSRPTTTTNNPDQEAGADHRLNHRFNAVGAKRLKVSSPHPLLEENRGGVAAAGAGSGAGGGGGGGNNNNTDDAERPWNLRTRRAACKQAPLKIEDIRNAANANANAIVIDSPTRRTSEIDSPRKNDGLLSKRQSVEQAKEKVKFSVSLSKQEIEQDFMEIARIRPPRRPKKRPRIVQKYLDSTFPGLWLSEVTPDSYKVAEVPES